MRLMLIGVIVKFMKQLMGHKLDYIIIMTNGMLLQQDVLTQRVHPGII